MLCDLYVFEGNYLKAIEEFSSKADKYTNTTYGVEMLARIAYIYGEYLGDKDKSKEYADLAASVNPGQMIVASAYRAADIEYDPMQYEDRFVGKFENYDNLPEPQKPADTETAEEFVSISPNPFNPFTTFTFAITNPARVTLTVYSITGQKVATLVDESLDAGTHSVVFDGGNLGSGMYFYRFESPGFARTGKMLLVK